MKNITALALVAIVLFSMVSISGCTTGELGDVRTADQASEAVGDVSSDIEEVTTLLGDIDQTLG